MHYVERLKQLDRDEFGSLDWCLTD
jgi:hypothetical protein